jgi:hypothetical protein
MFLENMSVPTFSLAYTSVRAATIPHVIRMWEDAAVMGDFEWVLCVDDGDSVCLAAAEAAKATSRVPFTIVINKGSKDCVSGWNTAAAATAGKVIIAVADDFVPLPQWDIQLLGLEPAGWVDGEHAVHVEDGYVHSLMVLPIITRARYARFGYLFYPKYKSMFCDTELTEVAYRDGVVIDAHHLLFEHMHPDCGKRNRDQNDLLHASSERWNVGEMLFNFRKAAGFPVDDGPKAVSTVEKSSTEFAVYMQVTQDDICLQEVCLRMMEEGCRVFFFAVPDTYWSGEKVPEDKLKSLDPVFAFLTAKGADVRVKQFQVARYRMSEKDDRITVETRLRNDSLAWIRKSGFDRILIVDGDELWMPGTLEMLKPYIERGDLAISVRMIPVIGVPGYPVEGATDVAVVYIGPKCNFRVCRTPTVSQTIIEQPRIIHFTSTRRTLEDNKAKHLRSGHYGDPDYDFDGWMQSVLPNVKPGMRDVHMYKPYSIWKSVRAWRPEELAIIPSTIHPYLGLEK